MLIIRSGYNLPPLESPAEPLKIDESGEENEQVVESKTLSKVADRVGSTVVNPNFEFAENATPEEEKAIVESVNQVQYSLNKSITIYHWMLCIAAHWCSG